MELTEPAKKLLLFVSAENPLWHALLGHRPTQQMIARMVGVAAASITNWKHTGRIDRNVASRIFLRLNDQLNTNELQNRNDIAHQIERFQVAYFDDKVPVYDAGDILGLSIEDTDKILDFVRFNMSPILSNLYYETPFMAQRYFQEYKGIYLVWFSFADQLLQCVLQVKYVLELTGGPVIRCKLIVPLVRPIRTRHHIMYDGFLSKTENNVYLVFQQDDDYYRKNYMFIITDAEGYSQEEASDRGLALRGKFMTVDQSLAQSAVTGDIILKHQPGHDSTDLFVWDTQCKIIDGSEAEERRIYFRKITEYLNNA